MSVTINLADINVNKGDGVESPFIEEMLSGEVSRPEDNIVDLDVDPDTFELFQSRKLPTTWLEIDRLLRFMHFIHIKDIPGFFYSNIDPEAQGYKLSEEHCQEFGISSRLKNPISAYTALYIGRTDLCVQKVKECIGSTPHTSWLCYLLLEVVKCNQLQLFKELMTLEEAYPDSFAYPDQTYDNRGSWIYVKDNTEFTSCAVRQGYIDFLKYFLEEQFSKIHLGRLFSLACGYGKLEMAKYIYTKYMEKVERGDYRTPITYYQTFALESSITGLEIESIRYLVEELGTRVLPKHLGYYSDVEILPGLSDETRAKVIAVQEYLVSHL